MAKKGFGKFVAFAAISGAVAAGVSYVLQYKIYHKELDKDFREFEEDEEDEDASQSDSFDPRKINRNYISLNSSRDEFKMAAKDMASATKNVLKDAGNLFSDTAHEAVSAAVDTAHIAIHSMKAKKDDLFEEEDDPKKGDSFTEEDYLDDDYVDDDDLYDYELHSPKAVQLFFLNFSDTGLLCSLHSPNHLKYFWITRIKFPASNGFGRCSSIPA